MEMMRAFVIEEPGAQRSSSFEKSPLKASSICFLSPRRSEGITQDPISPDQRYRHRPRKHAARCYFGRRP